MTINLIGCYVLIDKTVLMNSCYEVWDNVTFLHVCLILFTAGEGAGGRVVCDVSFPVWLPSPLFLLGGGGGGGRESPRKAATEMYSC